MAARQQLNLDYAESRIQRDRADVNSKFNRRPHGQHDQCEHCGASTVEYCHSLTKLLGDCLIRFYRYVQIHDGRARLQQLAFSPTQFNNFQKLRYWELIYHRTPADERAGLWSLTDRGEQFVRGIVRLPRRVWTYRASVVEYEGDRVLITELVPDFNWRVEWAQLARPHAGDAISGHP